MKQGISFVLFLIFIVMAVLGFSEQKQYGDYIYVPASGSVGTADMIHLTVEGIGYDPATGEPRTESSLSGAAFGVYVVSAGGEVRPWANPLFPTEQMKIRTGAFGASFSLPAGMEYYLIQESAQNGYLYDEEALIPVEGKEITVQNYMPAMVAVQVVDSLQYPVTGVQLQLTDASGQTLEQTTDAYGWGKFTSESGILGEITEIQLPDGVYPAKGSLLDGNETAIPVPVACEPGECAFVTFEHPAMGYVQMNATLLTLDDLGETVSTPLAGITMRIQAEPEQVITTDADGYAEGTLLEGTYPVYFEIADAGVKLPFDHASIIIESGGVTSVPVEAVPYEGRIAVDADFGQHDAEGAVSIVSESDGTVVATVDMTSDGHVISPVLSAGNYWVKLDVGSRNRIGELYSEQMKDQEANTVLIQVLPGKISTLEAEVAVPESQQYTLAMLTLSENGENEIVTLDTTGRAYLHGQDANEVIPVGMENGSVFAETFSGTYTLEMDAEIASEMGLRAVSEPFALPSQDGTILFPVSTGRILLHASDSRGEAAVEGVYLITDAEGNACTVATDENGLAITPMIAEGMATIENLELPKNCDVSPALQVKISAGELTVAEIGHPRRGTVTLTVSRQIVENGQLVHVPMEGTGVHLSALDGFIEVDGTYYYSDNNGEIRVSLPEGEYEAELITGELEASVITGDPVRFAVRNDTDLEETLLIYDTAGAVRVQLQDQENIQPRLLTQIGFELRNETEQIQLRLVEDAYVAENLQAGLYTLVESQTPAGYSPMRARVVEIQGGEITEMKVPLEEYATVTVTKYGLTFDDRLQNYLVPLAGGYGVFTLEGDTMVPYPSADAQVVVFSNVSADSGLPSRIQLPAEDTGTVYYLKELKANAGFALDSEPHEVLAYPGQTYDLTCSVSSDRGFYHLELADAGTGEQVSGATFTLTDSEGTVIETFELQNEHRNDMAIPVGEYTLTEVSAAPGYMLTETSQTFRVEPYLMMGGQVSEVRFSTQKIPDVEWEDALFHALSITAGQGMTTVTVDPVGSPEQLALIVPQMTLSLQTESGAAGIQAVTLNGVQEGDTTARVRVEYAADGCGWQSSQSQIVSAEEMPRTIVFPESDWVNAIRLTYLDAETGLEQCIAGFTPGDVSIQVCGYGDQPSAASVSAVFSGTVLYRTGLELPEEAVTIYSEKAVSFETEGSGLPAPAAMGKDGRISGYVFYDRLADGVARLDSMRVSSIAVTLCDMNGNDIDTVMTDEQGRYVFDTLPAGTYTVEFDGIPIYTHGSLYTPYLVSRVSKTGISEPVTIDADHTDEVLIAGCVAPATITGSIREWISATEEEPVEGCSVEFWSGEEEEPYIVRTDENGVYTCNRLLPGFYEIYITLPDGRLSREAVKGEIRLEATVGEGETLEQPAVELLRAARVSGNVRIDTDGNGQIEADAEGVGNIRVDLLERLEDGHTEAAASTVTAVDGSYAFEGLFPGEYVLSFVLDDRWVFTQYGADSEVFGSVAENGSTKPFTLECSQAVVKNAGVTLPSELNVQVFQDTRMDGIRQANEGGLANVRISLVRMEEGTDGEVVTAFTDETGTVAFDRVSPGYYTLDYSMPDIWRATVQSGQSDSAAVSFVPQSMESDGRSTVFAIPMGTALNLYIGAVQTGTITGQVFYDDNADVSISTGEEAVAGISVMLVNDADWVIATSVTDSLGAYIFEGLPAGRYRVRFQANEGECFSGNERMANRNMAERSDTNISATRPITLEGGRTISGVNAAVVRSALVRGRIFVDRNADRQWGEDEAPMPGTMVSLTTDSGRTVISTVVTDQDGAFSFENVYPGQYKLRIDASDDYVYAGDTPGNPLPVENSSGNWVYTQNFTILGNSVAEGLSYGFLQQGVLQGVIWEDNDYDGLYTGDAGIKNATVTLYDSAGTVCGTARTDRNGGFAFSRLMPGNYSLEAVLESGYVFTVEGRDSIAPRMNTNVCSVSLGYLDMGEVRSNLYIGALKPGSVTGYVWLDADDDGRRQAESQAVPNQLIELNVLSGSDAGTIYQVQTDVNGKYVFTGIMPGTLSLSITLPEQEAFARNANGQKRVSIISATDENEATSSVFTMAAGSNLQDMDIGVVLIGSINGKMWIDESYDGVFTGADKPLEGGKAELIDQTTGMTVCTVMSDADGNYRMDRIRSGDYRLRFTLPEGMIFTLPGESAVEMCDLSIAETENFRLPMGEHLTNMNVGAIVPAVLTGTIRDEDTGEGFPRIMVALMDGGTLTESVTTDSSGAYAFDLIRPGLYRLRYTLPEHALFALETPLNMTGTDAHEGETDPVQIAMGDNISVDSLQVVRVATVSGTAWSDANVNSQMDNGELALPNVNVTLVDDLSGKTIARHLTDENGTYTFGDLRRGTYYLMVELPEDELFTDPGNGPLESCIEPTENNKGESSRFELASGETVQMNIGGILPGLIGDTVWLDTNGNGLQDYKEPQLSDVPVTLLMVADDGTGEEIDSMLSDEYGYYHFSGLRPGHYRIRVDGNYPYTIHYGSPLEEIDSDIIPETGESEIFLLESGQRKLNVDIGLLPY